MAHMYRIVYNMYNFTKQYLYKFSNVFIFNPIKLVVFKNTGNYHHTFLLDIHFDERISKIANFLE